MSKRVIALTFAGICAGIVAVGVWMESRARVELVPTGLAAPVAIRWYPSLNMFSSQILAAVDEVNRVAGCKEPLLTVDSE